VSDYLTSGAAVPLLVIGAYFAGAAKASIGGLAMVTVALVTMILPVRTSTALVLLLLLIGDAYAISRYKRHADFKLLGAVVPAVLPGLAVGAVLLAVVPADVLRRGIGAILLTLVAMQMLLPLVTTPRESRASALAVGAAAGVTTMVANAGGPVMTLYLVAHGINKWRFLGTSAWFFAGVNLCKLPITIGLGLITPDLLWLALALAPAVLLGAYTGTAVVGRLGGQWFDKAVLAAGAASAAALLVT
jgi:uncharacterized membrane protein YfcA